MKSLIMILVVLALGVGQEKADLAGLSEKISSQIQAKLPDWKSMSPHTSGTLQSGIVVQAWCVPHRNVQVAIAIRESVEAAKKEIRSYLQFRREAQILTGFGDEAFAPEPNGYQYVLRRGRYVIYISTVVYIEEDADALSLTEAERRARERAEVERILKEFAIQFSAIDLPD
jgi:hypothetical protein